MTTVPLVVVGTLAGVAFHPVLWLARMAGRQRLDAAVRLLARLEIRLVRMAGTRVEVDRLAELSPDRGYVLVANHQSVLDVPLLTASVRGRSVGFVAKRSLARGIPSVSYALRSGMHALVDRRDPIRAMVQIRQLGRSAQAANGVIAIFPEGTRSRDGDLSEFRWAGLLALLKAAPELLVVPVAIDGSWAFMRHNLRPIPFGTRIRLLFGEPMGVGDDAEATLVAAQQSIASTLDSWRRTEAAG